MSQYATAEQLQANSLTQASYNRFTNNGQDLSSVNAALKARSDYCDMFLASQFVLPLTQWGAFLTKAVCDMAAYDLYTQFGYNPNAAGDKSIEERFKKAEEQMMLVSREELHLDTNPSYVDSSAGEPKAGPFVYSGLDNISFPGFGGGNGSDDGGF